MNFMNQILQFRVGWEYRIDYFRRGDKFEIFTHDDGWIQVVATDLVSTNLSNGWRHVDKDSWIYDVYRLIDLIREG